MMLRVSSTTARPTCSTEFSRFIRADAAWRTASWAARASAWSTSSPLRRAIEACVATVRMNVTSWTVQSRGSRVTAVRTPIARPSRMSGAIRSRSAIGQPVRSTSPIGPSSWRVSGRRAASSPHPRPPRRRPAARPPPGGGSSLRRRGGRPLSARRSSAGTRRVRASRRDARRSRGCSRGTSRARPQDPRRAGRPAPAGRPRAGSDGSSASVQVALALVSSNEEPWRAPGRALSEPALKQGRPSGQVRRRRRRTAGTDVVETGPEGRAHEAHRPTESGPAMGGRQYW